MTQHPVMKDKSGFSKSSQLSSEQLKALAGKLSAHARMLFEPGLDVLDGELTYCFRPLALPAPNGFIIRLTPSDSRLIVTLELDDFAGELIRYMVMNLPETKALWKEVVCRQIESGAKIGVEINGEFLKSPESLPVMNWDTFYVSWIAQSTATRVDSFAGRFAQISAALMHLSDLIGCVLPFDEDVLFEEPNSNGALEGDRSRGGFNKYERSRANRTACIALFGAACGVCGFDFEARYGEIGAGYMEVHHLTPVSMMGGEYTVAPLTDLIPLCSNCHSMAHTKTPPWTPSELQIRVGGFN